MSSRALVLFTRDLRVNDNPALADAAAAHGALLPLFVFDQRLLAGPAGAPGRVRFLLDSLEDLAAALRERGAPLVVRRGDPARVALALAGEHAVDAIYVSDDYSPWARRRLGALEDGARQAGIAVHRRPGVTVLPPGAVVPAGGEHYRVFTPYFRAWSEVPLRDLRPAPERIAPLAGVEPGELPAAIEIAAGSPPPQCARGGERVASSLLEAWAAGPVADYGAGHDELAHEGTSRLSAHLHFGTLSPVQAARAVGRGAGPESFVRQLCWRDFYHQLLAAEPRIVSEDYHSRGDDWSTDTDALAAWSEGLTGYPIVDAGMRQLAREGYMHNRARLIVGSFLTKHMYIDWREGAAHFARLLTDADVACNTGNWQWIAGTGTDTRPNRILNPLRQAKQLDPHGDYVRRHVPELAEIPGALIHTPWKLPTTARPRSYPKPLVELDGALTRLRERRGAP